MRVGDLDFDHGAFTYLYAVMGSYFLLKTSYYSITDTNVNNYIALAPSSPVRMR